MKKSLLFSSFIILLVQTAQAADFRSTGACGPDESWSFGAGSAKIREDYQDFQSGKMSAAMAYGEGYALQHTATTTEARIFGDFWKNRALFQAGLNHAAWEGFSAIASAGAQRATVGVQIAAIRCMNEIQLKIAGLPTAKTVAAQLPEIARMTINADERATIADQAVNVLQGQLIDKSPAAEVSKTLVLLRGTGTTELLARGLVASSQNDYPQTINALGKWLADFRPAFSSSEAVKKQIPHARLLLARAYYGLGKYDLAATQYGWVDKKSNEIAQALTEMAWAQLMQNKYADAIGASTNLEVGAMKNIFAPESGMVMAMAENELCQFPDSLRATKMVQRNYADSYLWLKQWSATRSASLYPLALQFLKEEGRNSQVPTRVASEWVRSNVFISHQEEIHSLFQEKTAAEAFKKIVAEEQAKLGEGVHNLAEDANVGIREERDGIKIYSPNAPATLKAHVAIYNAFRDSWNDWQNNTANLQRRSSAIQERLVAEVNAELASRNMRMLAQLDDVRENSELIEVEIFNGASHDMIWRNANPKFAEHAQMTKIASRSQPSGRVWDWGRVDLSQKKFELWEDEAGSFKAKVTDNCSSKEKYIALLQPKH